jgi:hypothetical protein
VNWVTNDLLAVDYNNRESFSIDLSGKQVATLGERFIRRMSKTGPLAESVLVLPRRRRQRHRSGEPHAPQPAEVSASPCPASSRPGPSTNRANCARSR